MLLNIKVDSSKCYGWENPIVKYGLIIRYAGNVIKVDIALKDTVFNSLRSRTSYWTSTRVSATSASVLRCSNTFETAADSLNLDIYSETPSYIYM